MKDKITKSIILQTEYDERKGRLAMLEEGNSDHMFVKIKMNLQVETRKKCYEKEDKECKKTKKNYEGKMMNAAN